MAASSSSGAANQNGVPGKPAPAWTEDVVWQKHIEGLREFPDGFSILELCAGAGTASIELDLLLGGGMSTLVGAWDISADVRVIYDCIHGPFAPVHLGERDGNILAIDTCEFPCANAVIGGPPCPPFSSVGKRRALADERSQPFTRCIDVKIELDNRVKQGSSSRPLMFFELENVIGIRHRHALADRSPLDILLDELQCRLGEDWAFRTLQLNSLDYGLPQSRKRAYLVGRKLQWYCLGQPAAPPAFERQVTPADMLDTSDTQGRIYTELQMSCLDAWKETFRQFMIDPGYRGRYAFVEVNRGPTPRTSLRGVPPRVDRCECLRAFGPAMHVVALGEGLYPLSLDRHLRMREFWSAGIPSQHWYLAI